MGPRAWLLVGLGAGPVTCPVPHSHRVNGNESQLEAEGPGFGGPREGARQEAGYAVMPPPSPKLPLPAGFPLPANTAGQGLARGWSEGRSPRFRREPRSLGREVLDSVPFLVLRRLPTSQGPASWVSRESGHSGRTRTRLPGLGALCHMGPGKRGAASPGLPDRPPARPWPQWAPPWPAAPMALAGLQRGTLGVPCWVAPGRGEGRLGGASPSHHPQEGRTPPPCNLFCIC